jgi:hypothetical protein
MLVTTMEGGRKGTASVCENPLRTYYRPVEVDYHQGCGTMLTPAIFRRSSNEEVGSTRHYDHDIRWLMREMMVI